MLQMLRETHKVVYWVPDEGWHLARGILDALNPRRHAREPAPQGAGSVALGTDAELADCDLKL